MDSFIIGEEDIYREYQITENGTPLDADLFNEIVVTYKRRTGVLLAEYTLTGADVVVEDGDQGIISVIIPKETTADETEEIYRVQIVTTETDSDYPSNTRDRAGKQEAFELIRAI